MSNQKAPSVGWALGFQWVLANTVGLVVGLMVGFVGLFFHGALFGVIAGTAAGIMQWLVLREYISRAGSWAAACIIGGAVGGLVYEAFARAGLAEVTIVRAFGGVVLGALVGGLVAGAIQWLVLRQQVCRAGWWVLTSTVGGAVAFAVGGAVGGALAWFVGWIGVEFLRQNIPGGMPAAEDGMRQLGKIVGVPVVLATGGAVAGVITGPVLIWLLRHPRSEAQFIAGDAHHSPGRD
jgi:hypothetical protein